MPTDLKIFGEEDAEFEHLMAECQQLIHEIREHLDDLIFNIDQFLAETESKNRR